MAPGKDLRVLETCQVVIRRHLEDPFEQQLRVVEHVAFHANTGEQAHRLNVITVRAKVNADELLGGRELTVGEQRGRRHYLGRELPQGCDVLGRSSRLLRLSRQPVESLEQPPARQQRRIDVYRTQEGLDRLRSLPESHVAVPALLVQPAETRIQALEPGYRVERRGNITREALGDRAQVENVTILRHRDQQRLGRAQRRRELPQSEQLAYALNFMLHHGSPTRTAAAERRRGTVSPPGLLEIVSERDLDDPRPQRRLLDDELIGAGERACV